MYVQRISAVTYVMEFYPFRGHYLTFLELWNRSLQRVKWEAYLYINARFRIQKWRNNFTFSSLDIDYE